MSTSAKGLPHRLGTPLGIALGAVLLRVIAGVGFVNYDTLYALAWGGQLSRGSTPAYDVPIAPTPHPLVEILGVVLSPLGPHAVASVTVALGFLALSACGWVIYRLGAEWFGRAAGALAGADTEPVIAVPGRPRTSRPSWLNGPSGKMPTMRPALSARNTRLMAPGWLMLKTTMGS